MEILCTDKTGTLTEGRIDLSAVLDAQGLASEAVLRLAFLNAALETGIENPLDAAIVVAARAAGLTTDSVTKVDEIPYDFMRRRLTIGMTEGDANDRLMITKGAFDNVLGICKWVELDGKTIPLSSFKTSSQEPI